jgi:hypothetical protein
LTFLLSLLPLAFSASLGVPEPLMGIGVVKTE